MQDEKERASCNGPMLLPATSSLMSGAYANTAVRVGSRGRVSWFVVNNSPPLADNYRHC